MDNISSIKYFIPEIILLLTGLALLTGFFRRRKTISIWALCGLFLSLFSLLLIRSNFSHSLFNQHIIHDNLSQLLKLILLSLSLLIGLGSVNYHSIQKKVTAELAFFIILGIFGSMILVSANNLVIIFLAAEIIGLSISMTRFQLNEQKSHLISNHHEVSQWISTAFFLLGLGLMYGLTGTLNLLKIGYFIADIIYPPYTLLAVLLMLIAGLGPKLQLFSLSKNQYNDSIISQNFITTLHLIPQISALGIIIRIIITVYSQPQFIALQETSLRQTISIFSAVLLFIGVLIPLLQRNQQNRFHAHQSVHFGMILAGIAGLNTDSISASIFYLIAFTISLTGVVTCEMYESYKLTFTPKSELTIIRITKLFFILSLAGLPPTAGFAARFQLLKSLASTPMPNWWFFGYIILVSAVLFYLYSRDIYQDMVQPLFQKTVIKHLDIFIILLLLLVMINLFLGLFWHPIINLINTRLTVLF